jgi:hypothetical protein
MYHIPGKIPRAAIFRLNPSGNFTGEAASDGEHSFAKFALQFIVYDVCKLHSSGLIENSIPGASGGRAYHKNAMMLYLV